MNCDIIQKQIVIVDSQGVKNRNEYLFIENKIKSHQLHFCSFNWKQKCARYI